MIEYVTNVVATSELEFKLYWTTSLFLVILVGLWVIGWRNIESRGPRITLHGIVSVYIAVLLSMSYHKYSDLQYRQVTPITAKLLPGETVGPVRCGKGSCNQVFVQYATPEGPVTIAKVLGQVYPEHATLYRVSTK